MIALLRTEMIKAVRRVRTLIVLGVLVGLPIVIISAIRNRGRHPRGDGGVGLFRLAQQSGLLVPAGVLSVTSGFLLVVIAGLLAGDSVAGDATSGNLRYLLLRPVDRTKVLLAKATVAGVLIWVSVAVVVLVALVAGVASFGSHAVVVPPRPALNGAPAMGGYELSTATLLSRVAFSTAYVALGLTALLAMGTFFSTLTDSASGAIGATIAAYIVSEILDGIVELGRIRYAFPTHYTGYWRQLFLRNQFPGELWTGALVQGVYLVVFGGAAIIWFRRKDIRC